MAMRAPQKTRGTRSRQQEPEEDKPTGRRTRGREIEPAKGRAVGDVQKRLEEQAEQATAMEKGAPMGRNFSFKGGQMVFDGAPVKDNEVVVIIAGAVIEKAFYEGDYDPDNPEAPTCFAFGTDPDELAPIEADVADLQSDNCASCEWNRFGTADRGKGKACKDVRRLALIPAGIINKKGEIELIEESNALAKAEFGFAKLPPTSLTPYAAFVRQVANTMKRPPHGVYAIMRCDPDPKNQFVISWEVIDLVDAKALAAVMERHDEAMKALVQPYTYPTDEEKAERKKQAKGGRNRIPGKGRAQTRSKASDDEPKRTTRQVSRGGGASATRNRKY